MVYLGIKNGLPGKVSWFTIEMEMSLNFRIDIIEVEFKHDFLKIFVIKLVP
jgi:hypothetical protein